MTVDTLITQISWHVLTFFWVVQLEHVFFRWVPFVFPSLVGVFQHSPDFQALDGVKIIEIPGPLWTPRDFPPRLRAELYEALAGRAEAHEAQSWAARLEVEGLFIGTNVGEAIMVYTHVWWFWGWSTQLDPIGIEWTFSTAKLDFGRQWQPKRPVWHLWTRTCWTSWTSWAGWCRGWATACQG